MLLHLFLVCLHMHHYHLPRGFNPGGVLRHVRHHHYHRPRGFNPGGPVKFL
jgi:hypothetical protein